MSIEAYGTYEEDTLPGVAGFAPIERSWNGHAISLDGENVAHLFKPSQEEEERDRDWHVKRDIKPLSEASGGALIRVDWGDSEGVKFSGGFSGEVRDDRGNSVKIEAKQDSDGKGNVTVAVEHKEAGK